MKRIIAIVLCFTLLCSVCIMNTSAQTISAVSDREIVYFEDGSYVITEWCDSSPITHPSTLSARSSTSRTRRSTYYSSSNIAIFSVDLTGYFTYIPGVSAAATSETVSVITYSSSATYVTKSSSHSGATVYGSGTVKYLGENIKLNVQMTCDKYGNIT